MNTVTNGCGCGKPKGGSSTTTTRPVIPPTPRPASK